jgi:hypothetical protein
MLLGLWPDYMIEQLELWIDYMMELELGLVLGHMI